MTSPAQAIARRMPSDERRAILLAVPDVGQVRTRRGRPFLDFSPELRGGDRFLWSLFGRPFLDEAHAEEVRLTICRNSRHMPLKDAAARPASAHVNDRDQRGGRAEYG